MAEDGSKKKAPKPPRNRRDVNLEIQARLSGMNKNLLADGKPKPRKISSASKSVKRPTSGSLESTSKAVERRRASTSAKKMTPPKGQFSGRLEPTQRSSIMKTPEPKEPGKSLPEQSKTATGGAKIEDDKTQLVNGGSDLSSTLSNRQTDVPDTKAKKMELATKKVEKKARTPKHYTDRQLKIKVAKLHKKTQMLRVEDPAVDKLINEAKESLAAIELLNKHYTEVQQESKTRTQQLLDDFEKLKTKRAQRSRELDSRIAQQVRAEIDIRRELEEMLKDSNFRSLPKGHSSRQRRREPDEQQSYFGSIWRSIFGS
nr:ER to Golgi vesicle transport protein, putative [Haemonchus contortus]